MWPDIPTRNHEIFKEYLILSISPVNQFLEMNFLSRDIIFIFSDNQNEFEGLMKNIIDSNGINSVFHNLPTNVLAMLNIEIPGDQCNNLNSFVFKYEGNQVLPFMDMTNTLTKISDFHGLNARFDYNFHKGLSSLNPLIRQFIGYLTSGHTSVLQ